ncbi:polysaccharide deacetylase family protein [Rossellomorea marisflavi]|uniref:polysaccharide deacetylase family protein n=1 Tax=Rossellomorea marisflavi TaxID=189381 RepID=UPI0034576343
MTMHKTRRKKRRKLNRRGKIAVGILLSLVITLSYLQFKSGSDKKYTPAAVTTSKEKPLTFDDGPSEVADRLLDVLDDFKMKATFFMLGSTIEERPEMVERMKEEGFGLALHGMTHEPEAIYSSPDAPLQEMMDNQRILNEQTGIHSTLIRLPYGSIPYLTVEMRGNLAQKGFRIWDWDIDSRDWELEDERYVQHTIEGIDHMVNAGEKPVVLLHDRPEVVKHLPDLLRQIKEKGYKTGVLTEDMNPVTFHCEGRCHPYVSTNG